MCLPAGAFDPEPVLALEPAAREAPAESLAAKCEAGAAPDASELREGSAAEASRKWAGAVAGTGLAVGRAASPPVGEPGAAWTPRAGLADAAGAPSASLETGAETEELAKSLLGGAASPPSALAATSAASADDPTVGDGGTSEPGAAWLAEFLSCGDAPALAMRMNSAVSKAPRAAASTPEGAASDRLPAPASLPLAPRAARKCDPCGRAAPSCADGTAAPHRGQRSAPSGSSAPHSSHTMDSRTSSRAPATLQYGSAARSGRRPTHHSKGPRPPVQRAPAGANQT